MQVRNVEQVHLCVVSDMVLFVCVGERYTAVR